MLILLIYRKIRTVKQVIDYLEETSIFSNADVFMEMPPYGEMTEIDSADEDESIVSVNKLSGRQLQLSAVAVCTIKNHGKCVILGSHNDNDVESDDTEEEEEQAEVEDVPATCTKRLATSKTRTMRKNRMYQGSGVKVTYMLDGQISPFHQRAILEPQI